jgi:hypothetical protein
MHFALLASLWIILPASSEPTPVKIDYQLYANGTEWRWNEDRARLAGCFTGTIFRHDVSLAKKAGESESFTVTISKDGKTIFTFKASHFSVFWISGDRLYRSNHHPSSMGAIILAYDLNTGKILWYSRLKGLQDPRPHSVYSNYLNLTAGEESVEIFGNEMYGRYFEVLDAKTGKTIGHKVFPEKK